MEQSLTNKLKIRINVLLAGTVFTVITIAAVLMVMMPLQAKFRLDAENSMIKIADTMGLMVENTINYPAFFLRSNAAYTSLYANDENIGRQNYVAHVMSLVRDAPFLSSFWYILVPDGFDQNGERYIGTDYGDKFDGSLFHGIVLRQDNGLVSYINLSAPEALDDPLYIETYRLGKRWLTHPYREYVTLIDQPVDTITLCEPLYSSEGKWLGTMGIDIYLGFLHTLIGGFEIFETGYAILTTEDGMVIHSPNHNDWMKNTSEIGFDRQSSPYGGVFGNVKSVINGRDSLVYTMPISFELVENIYYLSIIVPLSEINEDANRIVLYFILSATVILILFSTLLFYLSWSRSKIVQHARAAESRLRADNAAIESLSRMKSEYMSNMSHEIKTPLTVISGNIQRALGAFKKLNIENEKITRSLQNAQEEVMRVARLTENALKMASMQESHEKMKPLDTAELFSINAEAYRTIIEKEKNTLIVKTGKNLPRIFGNADQLIQVLTNILTNSNKHTKNGSITVDVQPDSGFVSVLVKDTGTGISRKLLPRVFERGVTGSDGSGLGLPICKEIIENHDGTIDIESELGKGTEVLFRIPVYEEGKVKADE